MSVSFLLISVHSLWDSMGWRCLLVFSRHETTPFLKERRQFSHHDILIALNFKDGEQALLFNSIDVTLDKYCRDLGMQYCRVYSLLG